jgi:hypothetical protein
MKDIGGNPAFRARTSSTRGSRRMPCAVKYDAAPDGFGRAAGFRSVRVPQPRRSSMRRCFSSEFIDRPTNDRR